jgi:hypothetical protein
MQTLRLLRRVLCVKEDLKPKGFAEIEKKKITCVISDR